MKRQLAVVTVDSDIVEVYTIRMCTVLGEETFTVPGIELDPAALDVCGWFNNIVSNILREAW